MLFNVFAVQGGCGEPGKQHRVTQGTTVRSLQPNQTRRAREQVSLAGIGCCAEQEAPRPRRLLPWTSAVFFAPLLLYVTVTFSAEIRGKIARKQTQDANKLERHFCFT